MEQKLEALREEKKILLEEKEKYKDVIPLEEHNYLLNEYKTQI